MIEPKPMPGEPDPRERMEFVLGHKEDPRGRERDPEEDKRRLLAQRAHLERLAKEQGLELRPMHEREPANESGTVRASRIKPVAQDAMDEAAAGVHARRTTRTITHPDGRVESEATTEFVALFKVRGALRELRELAGGSVKWGCGVCVKVGRWLRVTANASSDDESD